MFVVDNPGPPLKEKDIEDLEDRLGVSLAMAYRQFLLGNNGGTPVSDCMNVSEFGETDVQVFFGIRRTIESSCIFWNLETLRERLPNGLVPIASDSGGNVFCLSYRSADDGAIVYLDLGAVFGDLEAEPPVYSVAPTFEKFVANLKPLDS